MQAWKTGALALAGMCWALAADAASVLEYTILKEGKAIGSETVTLNKMDGRTLVDVKTETHVQVLFLKFDYSHERREIWKDGELLSVTSRTNDDGTPHHYELLRSEDGFGLMKNGKKEILDPSVLPLTLWTKAVVDRPVLLSVIDAEPYKVTTQKLGENHYKMDGDIQRELWFAEDGYLQKVAFKRKGFDIELQRQ
ncbi:DUF6134 family protein [Terasakiella pusilla]|uniref:DUF6134 family protein n=1 Tax=Terasakiella pusilla TaxID=64973 RepID=UPI003AA7D296